MTSAKVQELAYSAAFEVYASGMEDDGITAAQAWKAIRDPDGAGASEYPKTMPKGFAAMYAEALPQAAKDYEAMHRRMLSEF